MFVPTLSLGLVLLPFVSAAVHDVQVGGAGGKLGYSPEAIVSLLVNPIPWPSILQFCTVGCSTR